MSTISLKQALSYGTNQLRQVGIDSARLDAEILLGFVLGISLEKIISSYNLQLTTYNLTKYRRLISKRSRHYPIAYLTGSKEFYGINFFVNENVLVPRPETELLVEEVLKYTTSPAALRLLPSPNIRRGTPDKVRKGEVSILEIGTGSGCIALTLAKHLPKAKIIAVDISEKALKVARRNFRNAQYSISNIQFRKSNLLSSVKVKPNIIVANLPYLTKKELQEVSILREPKLALYGGKDGLDLYERMLKQIKSRLIDNDYQLAIFLEINPSQKNGIIRIIKKIFPDPKIEIKKDLANKDRIVVIKI